MSGIPVVIVEKGGMPVTSVVTGAPVMTVAANGWGIPITLTENAAPFIIDGGVPPIPPEWITPPTISGTPEVGQTLTGNDGTIA